MWQPVNRWTVTLTWIFHTLSRFFVDKVAIRVHKNNGEPNSFFPDEKPMYLFSSIWNADDWATRGGLEKTDWKKAPFVSSYKDFTVEACQWEDPYPACVSTTTKYWWDQYDAWHLSDEQKKDFAWVQRNLVIYDYCKDSERFAALPVECKLSPWDWWASDELVVILQHHIFFLFLLSFSWKPFWDGYKSQCVFVPANSYSISLLDIY